MTAKSIDFALRVAADLGDAKKEVDALGTSVNRLESAGQNAAKGLDASATAADKNTRAHKQNEESVKGAGGAHGRLPAQVGAGAKAMERGAVSAKQYQQAMRQLPAQITDIVTGLASGQSVFTVAIQQGGQLKDSFGGIVPAGRALLGTISPMVVGLTAGAAAFGLIAVAAFQSYQEVREIERRLISTGNVAGTTSARLVEMADNVGATTGGFGEAEQAVLALAGSGAIATGQLELAVQAAVDLSRLTGQSIEDTTGQIIKLAKSPTAAMVELNDQYHFLTLSTYEQVSALEQQGRTQEAAKLIVEEFARVHRQRAEEAREQAGWIESAWSGVGRVIAQVWNDLKRVGSESSAAAQQQLKIASANSELGALANRTRVAIANGKKFTDEEVAAIRRETARLVKVKADAAQALANDPTEKAARKQAATQRANDAAIALDREADGYDSAEKKRADRIAAAHGKANAAVADAIKAGNTALVKQIREDEARIVKGIEAEGEKKAAKPKKAPKPKKTEADRDHEAAQREIENLDKQIALLGQLEEGERRVSEEARVRYAISNGAYKNESAATKQQIIDKAVLLDQMREEREEAEKKKKAYDEAERNYERLRDALETPIESAISDIKAKIDALNQAMANGVPIAGGYAAELARIGKQSETKAPALPGQFQQMGGPLSDGADLAEYAVQLETWRADEIAKAEAFYSAKEGGEAAHQQRMAAIQAEYGARQTAYSQAQSQFMLSTASSLFGSLAEIARNGAGEQSKTYRALFALSQGFAVAQALIAVYQNAAEASKKAGGYPYNIPIIAGAIAQGLAIVAQIRSVQPQAYATGGRIRGPGTGTSDDVLMWGSNGEHVIRERSASQPGARQFLDDFNARGMAALYDWANLGRYAEGGMVMASPEARASISAPSASPTSLQNNMRFYNLFDIDALVQKLATHPVLEKQFVVIASENGGAIQANWAITT